MARITDKEVNRFHNYLEDSLMKLDSDKNIKKVHWKELSIEQLQKMQMIESHELDLEVFNFNNKGIESECFDIINFCLFIIDNIKGNN